MKTVILAATSAVLLVACSKTEEPKPAPPTATATAPKSASAPSAAASAARPTGPFEGEIAFTVKDEAAMQLPGALTFDIKGDKVRYAPSNGSTHAVGDVAAQRAYAFEDAQKTYTELDAKATADNKAKTAEPKVTKTGKTEKVAGLDCEDWTVEAGTSKVDVCAAKGIAFFDLVPEPKAGNVEPAWASTLTKEKAFPLRVVMHDKAGKEQYRAEATKVDRKKLDDSLFQVPSGYKKSDAAAKTASLP